MRFFLILSFAFFAACSTPRTDCYVDVDEDGACDRPDDPMMTIGTSSLVVFEASDAIVDPQLYGWVVEIVDDVI
jgi:hypothetical protein